MTETAVLLLDYRGSFWTSLRDAVGGSMNTYLIQEHLSAHGIECSVERVGELSLSEDWNGKWILYPSSEDPGLHHRGFILDMIASLSLRGGRPIPDVKLLQAHHDKVMMEMLRRIWLPDDPLNAQTHLVSSYEDAVKIASTLEYPVFVKPSSGAGSRGVRQVGDQAALLRHTKTLSRSYAARDLAWRAATYVRHPRSPLPSRHLRPVVVQRAIPDLTGDCKLLVFGDRYFAVWRRRRKRQPLASGSGDLDFQVEDHIDVEQLLNFAATVAQQLPSPFLSLDIAFDGRDFYLLEFQAVYFGPAALQLSRRHWRRSPQGRFEQTSAPIGLEAAYAEAVASHITEAHLASQDPPTSSEIQSARWMAPPHRAEF